MLLYLLVAAGSFIFICIWAQFNFSPTIPRQLTGKQLQVYSAIIPGAFHTFILSSGRREILLLCDVVN